MVWAFGFCLTGYAQEIEKSIFITSNTRALESANLEVLQKISKSNGTKKESALLLLGNAFPDRIDFSDQANNAEQSALEKQFEAVNSFSGRVIVIPGKTEWGNRGFKGIDNLEKTIQKRSKAKFYPNDGCPFKKEELNDQVDLIIVDSQWFLQDRDNYPYMNEDCEVNTESAFFLMFQDLLKKSQDKIKIVALHHPVYTNTKHGLIANTAGFDLQDFQNNQYRKLRNRLTTIARQTDDVIFVSGHDKNLQYLNSYGVPQIISGASGSTEKVKNASTGDFTSDEQGYARLDIYAGGKVKVHFFATENVSSSPIFSATVLREDKEQIAYNFKGKEKYKDTQGASIYEKSDTQKGGVYKGLWGKHYRKFYGQQVDAPVVFLDTLMGGLRPVKRGGGQQTRSLRLADENGREFVMRGLKKSTTQFLQANVSQDAYIGNVLDGTAIDQALYDFYTTANPYTPFAIGALSESVGVLHTNPKLMYIPKQQSLGEYNDDYGDELYLFEEHVGDTQTHLESFGDPIDILDTSDVFEEIIKSGKSVVDEPSYIRARLFDMLIGDWDRHQDQWRWALYKNADGTEFCKPIPRDRDQAFSKFDGFLVGFLTRVIPELRKMQSYDDDIRSVKWMATSPYPLDISFINSSDWEEWEKQAKHLQDNLTDADIENAFAKIPEEIKGKTIDDIKSKLKGRRGNIVKIARRYYDYLNRFAIVTGTQKDDDFVITRHEDGKTTLKVRHKDVEILDRSFDHKSTKEIWIYGLNGNDSFTVEGKGKHYIKIKIMGGEKKDTYDFKNTRKVKLYDYKSKKNTIVNKKSKKWLVDDFEVNAFDPTKVKHSANQVLPIITGNPDDGLRLGALHNYTYYGVQSNPFTQKHSTSASYYTATSGYDLSYKGEFSNIFHHWNFGLEGLYTSPNFSQNFFGFGNETDYDRDEMDLDFNRVRIRKWQAAVALLWEGRGGGSFYVKPLVESFDVENTEDRFVNTLATDNPIFDRQTYGGLEMAFGYKNIDNPAYPTLGMDFGITAGYKANIDGSNAENSFAYVQPHIGIDHKLSKNGAIVLASQIGGEAILGDDFEFYHGANLGGNNSLRGFRNERFTGKYSLFQNVDLRFGLGSIKTSIVPLRYGITGSFDYGRVWITDDTSSKWHNSAGGSLWMSGLGVVTANIGYFNSSDGGRVVFVLGFTF